MAAIAELSDIVVFNGIAVPLSLAGYSYYGILIGNSARGIASLLVAQMASGRRLYFSVNSETMTRIARFSMPYSGFVALQWLPIYAGPVVAGLFLGSGNWVFYNLPIRPWSTLASWSPLHPAFP